MSQEKEREFRRRYTELSLQIQSIFRRYLSISYQNVEEALKRFPSKKIDLMMFTLYDYSLEEVATISALTGAQLILKAKESANSQKNIESKETKSEQQSHKTSKKKNKK